MSYCNKMGCLKSQVVSGYCAKHTAAVPHPGPLPSQPEPPYDPSTAQLTARPPPTEHERVIATITKRLNAKREQILSLKGVLKSLGDEYQTLEGEYLRATRNR